MNFKAFVGFGFYGGTSATQRANLYSSWGLVADLPAYAPSTVIRGIVSRFWAIFRR